MTPRKDNGQFVKGTHWRPKRPHWEREWWMREYVELGRSGPDIGIELGINSSAVDYWLRKHGVPRRTVSEARALKRWGSAGPANGMFGKRGAECPSWRGGSTPERQAFHGSAEWREVSLAVWRRDHGTCRHCALKANDCKVPRFDVHHIIPFEVTALRAAIDNLVLLCRKCHRFIHSKKNINREWLA